MALKAGRVGVAQDQVDPYGNLRNVEPYILPVASADTLGGVKIGNGLSMTDGVLSALASGGKIYTKAFAAGTPTLIGNLTLNGSDVPIYQSRTTSMYIEGYTFIGSVTTDTFSGYYNYLLSTGIYYGNNYPDVPGIYQIAIASSSIDTWSCRAFYVKNEDVEQLT